MQMSKYANGRIGSEKGWDAQKEIAMGMGGGTIDSFALLIVNF